MLHCNRISYSIRLSISALAKRMVVLVKAVASHAFRLTFSTVMAELPRLVWAVGRRGARLLKRPRMIRPGEFGVEAMADRRRGVFDYHNEALLASGAPIDAVFLGDSITDMWALDVFFKGARGMVVNRGIGGDRTPFVRRRFESDVLQLRPSLLVLCIGVNNTWDLDEWDVPMRRTPTAIENEIVDDITAMVTLARENAIQVALCSLLPTDVPFNGNTAERNALLKRANARLHELASQSGAVWIDYHSRLVGDDGLTLREGLADDGLHPHVVGYQIMAETLVDA
ncbi:MAG: family lipolytic protein, partial [Chloroflexi bacterium]|nr:family lipolytic protein [Chloroflexota bacterium]